MKEKGTTRHSLENLISIAVRSFLSFYYFFSFLFYYYAIDECILYYSLATLQPIIIFCRKV